MELWSGRAPFRRHTKEEIEAAMRAPHPRPSDADIRLLPLDDVLASAMALDPAARPQQAEDLGRSLRRFLAGIDLGDVARKLGDRVRDLRVHPPPPATEPRPVLQRPPSRPTATQVGTKTFAAREDGPVALSARPAAPAGTASIPEVSTRRIESDAPPSAETAREPKVFLARPTDTTVATKPIETDPRGDSTRPRRGLAIPGVVGAAALAICAFFLGRAATDAPKPAATAEPATAVAPPAHSAPATAETPVAITAPPVAPSASARPEPAPVASARAQLTLVGDGAFVTVDGVARGACPAHVSVDAGPHTVVFSFPPTGESKGETLTLRVGDRATLRADFTGAAPSIRVQRM
jgi:hypothetical protein